MNPFLELMLRVTAIVLLGLMMRLIWWRSSASRRVSVLQATLLGIVLLPAGYGLLPRMELPVTQGQTIYVTSEPIGETYETLPAPPEEDSRIPWAWGIGSVVVLLYLSAGLISIMRIKRRPVETDDPNLRVFLASVRGPLTFGVRRPIVLVPLDFQSWPEAHRAAVLAHESAHIQRFDCAWRWLSSLACAVYWCHPLVWWLAGALRADSELAADERAIQSGVPAVDYAEALVAIAQFSNRRSLVSSQGVSFMNPYPLRKRVQHALHHRQKGFTTVGLLALVAATISTSGFVASVLPVAGQDKVIEVKVPPQRRDSTDKVYEVRTDQKGWKVNFTNAMGGHWKVNQVHGNSKKKGVISVWVSDQDGTKSGDSFWEEAKKMKERAPIKGENEGELYEVVSADQAKKKSTSVSRIRGTKGKKGAQTLKVYYKVQGDKDLRVKQYKELKVDPRWKVDQTEHVLSEAEMKRLHEQLHLAEIEVHKALDPKRMEMSKAELEKAIQAAHKASQSFSQSKVRAQVEKELKAANLNSDKAKAEIEKAMKAAHAAQKSINSEKMKVEIERAVKDAHVSDEARAEVEKAIKELHSEKMQAELQRAQAEAEKAAVLKEKIHATLDAKTMARIRKQIAEEMAKVREMHLKVKQESSKKKPKKNSPPKK